MKKIGHCCVTSKVAESRKQNLGETISWSISDDRSSKKSIKTEDNLIITRKNNKMEYCMELKEEREPERLRGRTKEIGIHRKGM
jgi:hypothetical protein